MWIYNMVIGYALPPPLDRRGAQTVHTGAQCNVIPLAFYKKVAKDYI